VVLIEVRNSDGVIGRCDARCYDAGKPECDCCCGGINHGVGRKRAMDHTRGITEAALRAKCGERESDNSVAVRKFAVQGELF